MSLLFPRRARFWGPKRTPKTASTVGLPTVGSPPVSLVFGYRNRPPEPGLSPRSKPVSCVEFWLARPQHIFEFVNHSRTGLLGRRCCETQTINQLRRCVCLCLCVWVCAVCVCRCSDQCRCPDPCSDQCSDQCKDVQISAQMLRSMCVAVSVCVGVGVCWVCVGVFVCLCVWVCLLCV